jgi:predicted RNA-binding protein with PUA-like domain
LRKHAQEALSGMLMLRRGNRLSVTPVTREEWRFICSLE